MKKRYDKLTTMNKRRIARSIKDIQVQAQRLRTNKTSVEEMENFFEYSEEIRLWLAENIESEFVQERIIEIPSSDQFIGTSRKLTDTVRSIHGGLIGSLLVRNQKKNEFSKALQAIEKAYANVEYFLKTSGELD
jgi:hypothetical protein